MKLRDNTRITCTTIRFSRKTKRGRHPLGYTTRRQLLHDTLTDEPKLPEEVVTALHWQGPNPSPQAYADLKDDLIWLVTHDLAALHISGPEARGYSDVRPPIEPERAYYKRTEDWMAIRNGFVLGGTEPYRLNNLLFMRTEKRPHGHAVNLNGLYDCLPDTHHVRMESLRLPHEVERAYPTPKDRFDGLMDLHRRGSVEIEADGL